MKSNQIKKMVLLSLFITIEIVLTMTPLGFIALGPIRSTTLHIPVILAGLLLGYKEGFIVGGVFGLLSIIVNTFSPTPTSFVFSPFYSLGEINGNVFSLLIALVPRILLGGVPVFISRCLSKLKSEQVRIFMSAALASFIHTCMVMMGIYFFFGQSYAAVKEVAYSQILGLIQGVIFTNGLMEMFVGAIIVTAVYQAVSRTMKGQRKV
ncbi:MAG: ECF transporter S component [Erysipelotrichaceae bacterium]